MKNLYLIASLLIVLNGASCVSPNVADDHKLIDLPGYPIIVKTTSSTLQYVEFARISVVEKQYGDEASWSNAASEYAIAQKREEPLYPLSTSTGQNFYSFLKYGSLKNEVDNMEMRFSFFAGGPSYEINYYEIQAPIGISNLEYINQVVTALAPGDGTGVAKVFVKVNEGSAGINGRRTLRAILDATRVLGTSPNQIPMGKFGIVINPPYP